MPEHLVTPRLLSVKNAARYIGVSERHVGEWIAKGMFATRKIGSRRLVEKESLDEFINRAARSPALWESEELAPKSPAFTFAEQVAREVVRLLRQK